MPFILEKLSESAETAAKSLSVLTKCVQKFSHNGPMKKHLEVTISTIENQYFNILDTDAQRTLKEGLASILNSVQMQSQ